ncbi:MAG: hypothetical protein JNJ93_09985, partial [Acinetobacter sp.]|nr:hypothetical protein [Acinetobacter sp.]
LGKVHVNHAVLREAELVVLGNVNLAALFSRMASEKMGRWDDADLDETEVTPIRQKGK